MIVFMKRIKIIIIDEASKHEMILLTTRRTKESWNRIWSSQRKRQNDAFEDLAMLDVKLGRSSKRNPNTGRT